MTYDIVTFGSATRDIFLRTKNFLIGDFKIDHIQKEILLPYGFKINVEEMHLHSGGGGTNTAATFAAQGLKIAYCGLIGNDPEGEAIVRELKKRGISTNFISKTKKKPTNISVIFSTPKERTILVYKGASEELTISQIPWSEIKKTKWFYLGPFSQKLFNVFKSIVNFAKDNNIKIMLNPSTDQLKMPSQVLYPLLNKIDILILNKEEAQVLIENSSSDYEDLFKKIREFFSGIIIITNGVKTVFVGENNFLYLAKPLKINVLDKTGAGDAFGSGFLATYINTKGDIIKSIQFAIANSASCLKKWGAKGGILKKGQKFRTVKVIRKKYEDA